MGEPVSRYMRLIVGVLGRINTPRVAARLSCPTYFVGNYYESKVAASEDVYESALNGTRKPEAAEAALLEIWEEEHKQVYHD